MRFYKCDLQKIKQLTPQKNAGFPHIFDLQKKIRIDILFFPSENKGVNTWFWFSLFGD